MRTVREILEILQRAMPELARDFQVTRLALSGSSARRQQTEASDVVSRQRRHPSPVPTHHACRSHTFAMAASGVSLNSDRLHKDEIGRRDSDPDC